MTPEFLITSLVVVLLPGTGVVYTMAVGLGQGFKAGVAAAAGCTIGIVPAAFASIAGLAALLHTSAVAFQTVKYLGVIYLFYMAWNILQSNSDLQVSGKTKSGGYLRIAISGTLLNVLNPKLSMFFLAFLPQFVSENTTHPTRSLLTLASVFMSMTFVVFIGYGAFAAYARKYITSKPGVIKWLKRSFAGTFGLLGLKLAFSDR